MGRKTLESFPKALPNRAHIAITRERGYTPKFPCEMVHSLEDAIALVGDHERAFIIGGGEIYRQAMDYATDIELTRIHASFEADTFFPEIDLSKWTEVSTTFHDKDEDHQYAFSFITYSRI